MVASIRPVPGHWISPAVMLGGEGPGTTFVTPPIRALRPSHPYFLHLVVLSANTTVASIPSSTSNGASLLDASLVEAFWAVGRPDLDGVNHRIERFICLIALLELGRTFSRKRSETFADITGQMQP